MTAAPTTYPVRFSVDYPEGPRDRLSVLLRLILSIPALVLVTLLSSSSARAGAASVAAGVAVAVLLMILFRQKYPRWWFDWLVGVYRFSARVAAYLALQRDEYPATDEEQAVHLQIDYPDATQLNRWLPLVKWLLAIPHYIVLIVLGIAAVIVTIVAWFMILVTGHYPRSLFDFTVGVSRWCYRVSGYAFLLVTDRYPPFSLE